MEELEILRKKLYSIQRQDNTQKLSERNCIEIIVKMIDLKMIDIIHSLDGKEYITPKQLENEIKDEILKCGGRVVVCDLQSILSIDIIHIEEALEKLKKRDKSIQIYQGEIMTRYYLDSILQEIQEQLQEVGKLHINDLSNRFSIGVDFLINLIEQNLKKFNRSLNNSTNNNNNNNNILLKNIIFDNQEVLYTQSHINRHYHKVIGLFSSITQPILINNVIKQHQNHYQLNERLVRQQLQELIENKRINGFIQGKASNAEFIPTIFSQSRLKWIDSFYHQNQFITFDSVSKLQINEPQSFLKNTFTDGLLLHSCFIHKSLIDKIDDNIIEIIENSNWLDLIPLLPPLTDKDISMIVSNCPNMKTNNAILLGNSFIISKSFVDRCFTLLQKTIQERMEKQQLILENIASSNIKKQQQSKSEIIDQKIETTTTTTTTTQPSKKKDNLINSDDDDNQDNNKKSSKGKNKKSKQQQSSIQKLINDSEDDYKVYNKKQENNNNNKKVDHLKEINQLLSKWYENMEEELVESLSQYLRPLVNQSWESMVKEAKEKLENETQKQRKQQLQQLNSQFFSLYNSFLLFRKGLQSLNDADDDNGKTIIALEKHLLKTVGINITNLLIEINANYHMLDKTTFETPSERSLILSQFPPQLSKSFEKLIQSLNKSTLNDFIDSLENVCSQSQIKLKSLDKKLEKQLLIENQNELEEQFLNEIDVGNQFQIIVNLMYIRYKNNYIFSPPRLIGKLVSTLVMDTSIDKEIITRLTKLHQEIVKLITNNKLSNQDNDNDSTELNDHIKFFKDLILN
ncbi:hypothetical protein DDB_G0283667 [Dictyostelium discoideum AX4]|uniref:E3 UFM1-protein ligase 1 homolog n=1 Tax=Dictyostelium discoideum TaxID=44689 RepID=UFL1_DICDI|nr:hypothetical protein DDB_G0283667 [Dictyostelium discoideum AX4]Q54QS0.1 RecName: Full=E3 UFM1-protein ligase 1 homolog [Dictyostelium discoideum]EAL65600.1 hypothetical protein DDB_G0283667 [Dictyostelium discoideum AX4]|eukprot:XP_638953.1 hypothetical protein DDB_G0283667 [Dictyostelium discoideum AX4]